MPDTADPISQLSAAARESVARLEHLSADITGLRGRVEHLESRLEAAHTDAQQTRERLESLQAHVDRLEQLAPAMAELRTELVQGDERRHAEAIAAVEAVRKHVAAEAERLSREVGALANRVEGLEDLPGRLEALARERAALARAVATAEERAEAALSERQVIQEDMRRSEQRNADRIGELEAELRDLADSVASWQGRIEGQSETVREARAVADFMREEAARLRHDHHAMAEAERVFEQSVDNSLTEMRREIAETWTLFRRERDADWTQLTQANEARDGQDQEMAAAIESILARLEALEQDLHAGLTDGGNALADLRQDLAGALGSWRQAMADATEIVEATVGQTDTAAAVEERRQALRRALRAQRSGRGG